MPQTTTNPNDLCFLVDVASLKALYQANESDALALACDELRQNTDAAYLRRVLDAAIPSPVAEFGA